MSWGRRIASLSPTTTNPLANPITSFSMDLGRVHSRSSRTQMAYSRFFTRIKKTSVSVTTDSSLRQRGCSALITTATLDARTT